MADIKYNAEEYIDDYDVELDDDTIERIRRSVNDWSNDIPYQPYTDMGDAINLRSAELRWLYRSELHTQFDVRSVKAATVPYQNQPLPDFMNDRPERVDLWSPKLQTTDCYGNSSTTFHTVQHSQTVSTCGTCNGKGEDTCPSCHGSKSHQCITCNGSGNIPHIQTCGSCYGRGYTVTYTRKTRYRYENGRQIPCGTDSVPHNHTCSSCGGSGRVQRGYDRCSNCGGSGRVTCRKCEGTGKVTCPTCKGYKKLYHYLYIAQQLEYKHRKLDNIDISDADYGTIIGLLDDDCYVELDKYVNANGPITGDFTQLPFVGTSATKLLDEKHAMQNGGRHILFETLRIKRTPIIQVDYALDGICYTLYITDNNKVAALHSPISIYTDRLRTKTIRQAKWRMLRSADRNFEKLYYITLKDEFWSMSESVAEKMHNDTRFGSNLALAILAVLLFPLTAYYLDNVSWVAPWINLGDAASSWVWKFLPYIYTAAATFGGYKISRLTWWYLHEKTPSFILRMLLGATEAIVGVLGSAAVLMLAHFIILPTVWETAGQIILMPWNLIMGVLGFLF